MGPHHKVLAPEPSMRKTRIRGRAHDLLTLPVQSQWKFRTIPRCHIHFQILKTSFWTVLDMTELLPQVLRVEKPVPSLQCGTTPQNKRQLRGDRIVTKWIATFPSVTMVRHLWNIYIPLHLQTNTHECQFQGLMALMLMRAWWGYFLQVSVIVLFLEFLHFAHFGSNKLSSCFRLININSRGNKPKYHSLDSQKDIFEFKWA